MKKKLTLCFAGLLALTTLLFIGCYKDKNNAPENNIKKNSLIAKVSANNERSNLTISNSEEISNDEDYINLVNDYSNFLELKKDTTTMNRLLALGSLSEDQKQEFAKAVGFPSKEKFEEFGLLQNQRIHNLDVKYGLKSNSERSISHLVENTIENNEPVMSTRRSIKDKLRECNMRFGACLAQCTAFTIGAHIACLGVDYATVGFGFYLCHGAAALYFAGAAEICALDRLECRREVYR